MRFFILFFPAKCGQECGQITGIFILLKHDFNGGKRKSVYGKTEQEAKRKRREWKKNVNSSAVLGNDRITVGQPMKRYQKILVRQTEPGYKAKQGRAQGKQSRAQGKTGPDADTGITGKTPLRRKTAKNAAESLFPLFEGTFLCCSIQRLKRGFCPVYGEAEGIMTYPYQK